LAFQPPLILARPKLSPAPFTARFDYLDSDERNYVVQTAKFAGKDRTRIHLLTDDNGVSYGFAALSLAVFENRPSLLIDYLFTSHQYRGVFYPELGSKISDYFIGYSIEIASTIRPKVPLRYIVLQAATPKLEVFYQKRGFMKLDSTHWMFLRF
jgi:hypothetical protein